MTVKLPNLENKHLLILLTFYSLIALICAYIAQHVFDFQPCILCLYQRAPFFLLIIICATCLTFRLKKFEKIALFLSILLLIANSTLAFYQVGVEKKIFQGPTNCQTSNDLNKITDLEELKKEISQIRAVRCDKPSFVIFGLSMAFFNAIYCLILASSTIYLICTRKRNLS